MYDNANILGSDQETVMPIPSGTTAVNLGTSERLVSIFGGTFLAVYGLKNPSLTRLVLGGIGVALIKRGISGYSTVNKILDRDSAQEELHPIKISQTILVNKPKSEVYAYWRKLENLPKFMKHLETVEQLDEHRSHWVAKLPGDLIKLEWDAEILSDQPDELISWRSIPNADVDNSGEVRFKDTDNGMGTAVQAVIKYIAPAGQAGESVAKLFNPAFGQVLQADLERFKEIIENQGSAGNATMSGVGGNQNF